MQLSRYRTRRIGRCLFFAIIFALLLMTSVYANEGKIYNLENGLNVFIKEMTAAPVVAVNIWVNVGSRLEKTGEEGYSHFVEHMLFKGTPNHPSGSLDKEIKKLGARQNAFTSLDYTCYYLVGAKEHFGMLMTLLADAVFNSSFDPEEFEKERKVILEELRMTNDNPERLLFNLTKSTAYSVHPYRNPVIGYESNIASATRDSVYNFYRSFYVPSNMWVVIVGDVNSDEVYAKIRETLGGVVKTSAPERDVPTEPYPDRKSTVRTYGDIQQAYVNLAWHVPGISSSDNYALDIISQLAGGGTSSRLYRKLVEEEKLVHQVNTSYYTSKDPSLFLVHGRMSQSNIRTFTERACRILREIFEGEITESELEKAKQRLIASFHFTWETAENQAFTYGHYALLADVHDADLYIERIKATSIEDIRRVAAQTFMDRGLTVATYEPRPADTVRRPEMLTLDNDMRLIIKENHASPVVAAVFQIDAGGFREGKKEAGLAHLTASTLLKGTEKKSAEEIATAFDSMGTRISCVAQKSFVTIKMQCLTEYFIPSLTLLVEILNDAQFGADNFKREQEKTLELIKEQDDDLFFFTYFKAMDRLFKDTPLAYPTFGVADEVKKLKRSDAQQFYKKNYIASNMVVGIAGDIYPAEITEKIVGLLTELPKGKSKDSKQFSFPKIKESVEIENQKNRNQSQILVLSKTIPRSDPKLPALDILKNILSGSPSSRLFRNLRIRDSLAYSVWAGNTSTAFTGYFYATLGTSVDNTETAKRKLLEELEKIRTEGFSKEEFDDAKKYITGQCALELIDNISQADRFSSDEFFGLGHDYYLKYIDLIENTDMAAVASVACELLPGGASSTHVLSITHP